MTKKALCVGINNYPFKFRDLRGCINDANAWSELLISTFGFPSNKVTLLTDQQATKKNIMQGLRQLIRNAKAGDVLVYTFSGHGTYIADKDGDEEGFDEAQCPYFESPYDSAADLILDDELRQLFKTVPSSVHLTVISDSCHSGSVSLAPDLSDDLVRPRFLNPEVLGLPSLENMQQSLKTKFDLFIAQKMMKEVLLSGCKDDQYSYDAWMGDKFHGVFSYHAIRLIKERGFTLSYKELINEVDWRIGDLYNQSPQLLGHDSRKSHPVFS